MNSDFCCADFAFLDSGTGGIPYMLALKQKQPSARCVYLGDTKHFPYGEKSVEEIDFSYCKKMESARFNNRLQYDFCNCARKAAFSFS